jgi:hypothetical protein
MVTGRVWVTRKTQEAIKRAEKQLRRNASRDRETLQPETLEYAKYIIVFTPFDPFTFSAAAILQWYRVRWQVELAFKRLKSLTQLGPLPKADDQSARTWLYGKLFIALLTAPLIRRGQALSPYSSTETTGAATLSLARVCLRIAPDSACDRAGTHATVRAGFVAPSLPGINRAPAPPPNAGVGILIFLKLALMPLPPL